MTDNRVVQGLWIGPSLSVMERLSIASFLANGHDYHLYAYDPPAGIPPGTTVRDAAEILPRDRVFVYKSGYGAGSYAGFADLFRYALLHARGGWWSDTDVVCLRPFDHAADAVICSSREGEWGTRVNSCVLKFPPGGPLTAYLLRAFDGLDPDTVGFGDTGPQLVQRMVKDLSADQFVAPPEDFCPIGWRGVHGIAYPAGFPTPRSIVREVRKRLRRLRSPHLHTGKIVPASRAVHLWNENWRNSGLDKNAAYSPRCLYERLKARYLPPGAA